MTAAASEAGDAASIRAKLGHPVIDGDGHLIEVGPVFLDYLEEVAGPDVVGRYTRALEGAFFRWYDMSPQERRHHHVTRPAFWVPTGNTLDRATAMFPALLRERMDALGIDFSVLYPTDGLLFPLLADDELRLATCRAANIMNAELFGGHADRMTTPAIIPMHTPEEALAELDFAIGELGLKAIYISGTIERPIPAALEAAPELSGRNRGYWIDPLGLDSAHDYDPVWQRCVDLKVAVTEHTGSQGWVNRASVSNYMYNHIGHFAASGETFCKALFLGGVTRRFPTLKFAFLECGVGWACSLYNDLIGHWEKRNFGALMRNLDPARMDRAQFADLVERYADDRVRARIDETTGRDPMALDPDHPQNSSELDEWAACAIERAEDIRDLFVPNFYFGCEADDPMTAVAFNTRLNRFGARLNAMMSSDIGHWDVPDASQVLCEAYELVEHEVMTEDDLRGFVFTNPVGLHTGMNPDFFKGTVVEDAVAGLLSNTAPA